MLGKSTYVTIQNMVIKKLCQFGDSNLELKAVLPLYIPKNNLL